MDTDVSGSGDNTEGDTEIDEEDGLESEPELTFDLEPELKLFPRAVSDSLIAATPSPRSPRSPRIADVCALPDEVFVYVTRYLRLHDVISLLETSRRFNKLSTNKDIWVHLYAYYDTQLGPMFEGMQECRGWVRSLGAIKKF